MAVPVKLPLYFRDVILAYKFMYCHVPSYLSCQFIKRCDVSKRTTRSSASDLFITVYSQLMELIRNFFKTQLLIKPVYFILVEGYCRWKLSSGNLYLLDLTMRNRSEKWNFRSLAGIELDLLQVSLSLSYRSTIVYITWRSTERRSEKERLVNFGKSRFKTEPKMQDLL